MRPAVRRSAALLLAAAFLVALLPGGPAAAAAAAHQTPSTTVALDPGAGGVIPRPNSGRPPADPGDRGGWAQLTLLGIVTAGLVFIAGAVVVTSRRARRTRSRP